MNSGYRPKDLARNWRRERSEAIYHNSEYIRPEDREKVEYNFGASSPEQKVSRRREGNKIIIEID